MKIEQLQQLTEEIQKIESSMQNIQTPVFVKKQIAALKEMTKEEIKMKFARLGDRAYRNSYGKIISLLHSPLRDGIFAQLLRFGFVTAPDLEELTGMSSSGLYYHLNRLEKSSLFNSKQQQKYEGDQFKGIVKLYFFSLVFRKLLLDSGKYKQIHDSMELSREVFDMVCQVNPKYTSYTNEKLRWWEIDPTLEQLIFKHQQQQEALNRLAQRILQMRKEREEEQL